ncbi:hypothetical protein C2W62_11400 [Candidatus Entotheonella serta]|nr:hypothetical protein C2W62_11400 [Candidatus Entotheonella serta]
MKYGFTLPGRGPFANPDDLGKLAKQGEDLGYDTLHTGDHIVVPKNIASTYPYSPTGAFPGSGSGEYLEQLTMLSYLAGQTQTIRLVTSVIIVSHRNPLVAAKALATLDVLSKGRLVVGVGVGRMQEEFDTLGIPPFKERGAVTDEYLQAFKELWTSDDPTFEGKYCSFSNIDFFAQTRRIRYHIRKLIENVVLAGLGHRFGHNLGWDIGVPILHKFDLHPS